MRFLSWPPSWSRRFLFLSFDCWLCLYLSLSAWLWRRIHVPALPRRQPPPFSQTMQWSDFLGW